MALIHCPECEREISNKVKACPHCGYPLPSDGEQLSASEENLPTPENMPIGQERHVVNKKTILFSFLGLVIISLLVFSILFIPKFIKKEMNDKFNDELRETISASFSQDLAQEVDVSGDFGSQVTLTRNEDYSTIFDSDYEDMTYEDIVYTMTLANFLTSKENKLALLDKYQDEKNYKKDKDFAQALIKPTLILTILTKNETFEMFEDEYGKNVFTINGKPYDFDAGVLKYNNYIDNLHSAMITMLNGGSDSESLLNLTAKVWWNTIYEESDNETDKYTGGPYFFHDDFNTSLANLFADSSTITMIANIESNQDLVDSIMKELQNPPNGLEKCYDTVIDLYSTYKSLTDLAIDPSGSLNSFTASKNEKIDAFLELYGKLEILIPEKK